MVAVKSITNTYSTLKRRYQELNDLEKRQFMLLFQTQLSKPVKEKAVWRIMNYSNEQLKTAVNAEKIQLIADFFKCSVKELYEPVHEWDSKDLETELKRASAFQDRLTTELLKRAS